jgi:hypothetical protein
MPKLVNFVCLVLVVMSAAAAAAQTSGNGDGASFSTANTELDTWWGLGIKSLCSGCTSYNGAGPSNGYGIVLDARAASIYTQGSIGIGTATPAAPLDVTTGSITAPNQVFNALTLHPVWGVAHGGNGVSIYLGSMTNHGPATVAGIWSALGSGGDGGVNYDGALVMGTTNQGDIVPSEKARIDRLGNFGIGTTSPGAKLDVNGNVKLSGSGASMIFPDETVQATAWNGVLSGGDYAESVKGLGDPQQYEPGDVLVLSEDSSADVVESSSPYSTLVAGIYSTKPGVLGRRQAGEKTQREIPMAMVGIVPTKVSAENGPIKRGDLLVTSSTAGYAMKGTDPNRMFGAVVGKAMGTLGTGTGVIEVLVSLQ